MKKIPVLSILLGIAIAGDVVLQKCYIAEIKSVPRKLNYCYWTLTNLVAVFGFATQVFLPYTAFEKLNKIKLIFLWTYCVIGNCIFRVLVYFWRDPYLHLIAGPWAFFNDFNSWVLVPFLVYRMIKEDTILNNHNSISIQNRKMYLLSFTVVISILVDVIEFSTNIDGLAQWWVYAVRIPIIVLITQIVIRSDENNINLTIKELIISFSLYNLLQIVLNDMPYVAKNIMLRTTTWKFDADNYRIMRSTFFFVYTICFWFINNTAIKLVKLLEKHFNKSLLQLCVIFSFYDTYMMAMLVITNTDLDGKFFMILSFVILRKILFSLAEILDWLPAKLKTSTDLEPVEFKKNLISNTIIKQINGFMCYIIGVICYVVDYYISGEKWLGGLEKTFGDLLTRLFICNIYLGSEIFICLLFWIVVKYKKIDTTGIKEKVISTYDDYGYFLWIMIYSYVIHITFFWEPL